MLHREQHLLEMFPTGIDPLANVLGGDYRFQSQWLESETGLYYFRARNYDAQTGRFISRDPVDIIEGEPESFNPYQFAYNNPLIYSDPSGEITILELNARENLQNSLNGVKYHTKATIKDELIQEGQKLAADAVFNALESFLPINFQNRKFSANPTRLIQNSLSLNKDEVAGIVFEVALKSFFCEFVPNSLHQRFFFEPDINVRNGNASNPGYQCPQVFSPRFEQGVARPDFIVTPGRPRESRHSTQPYSYLIGDIKLSVSTIVNRYFGNSTDNQRYQWDAMVQQAKNHGTKIIAFTTLFAGKKDERADLHQKIVKEATADGVIVFIASAQ